jgi:carbonic anhydrase
LCLFVELSQGPLKSKYKLVQFHMHWGARSKWGSEHTMDGMTGAGELHFVFANLEKYKSFDEAIASDDGLAVLGVIVKVCTS